MCGMSICMRKCILCHLITNIELYMIEIVGMCISIVRDTYEDIVGEANFIWYAENEIQRTFADNH